MKAIIMAGGEGKRLRPITCTMPKPLVPVLNRPIVDYTMELLKKHGITEATYTLHYMSDVIKDHVGDGSAWGMHCNYSCSEKSLGTAGSVREAVGEANERLIVLSGDGITDVDITSAIHAHENSGASVTIVLKNVDEPTEYGVAIVDESGMVTRFIEKPEQSEVFSDLANTGIYILEPEAVRMIPQGVEFDFSKQLFPKIMDAGMKIFGYKMDGYWCDVGDISEYRRAQKDMLDGKCSFQTTAKNYNGIYIEANAKISDNATLIPPCYIGSGVSIGDGVLIEPYTVIGSGASIESGSSIKRSIIFDDVKIRRNVEIRGAVVCENAHIDDRASMYEGSTIGAETHLGVGVSVLPNVSIWPGKDIEGGFSCRDNIVWGNSARRAEIDGSHIRGYMDNQLTPEAALRLGAAYASRFKPPARLAICADGSQVSVILKHSIISGVASQGVDAVVVNPLSKSAFALTIAESGCIGGMYVEGNDSHGAVITVYDKNGIEASGDIMRSIKASFIFGEQKPSVDSELGLITQSNGMEDIFENRLLQMVDSEALRGNPKTLRLNSPEQFGNSITRILLRLGWRVENMRNSQKLIPAHDQNTLSVAVDSNGMMSMAAKDAVADEQAIMAMIAAEAIDRANIKRVVLPATIAEEYRDVLKAKGVELYFAPEEKGKLRRVAFEKNAYYAPLHEQEAKVLKLCEMFSKGELLQYYNEMPVLYSAERRITTTRRDMGRMLRSLVDGERKNEHELIDGLRLKLDTGWVVVHPSAGRTAAFRVVAGSSSSEYAKELCDIYTEKLNKIRDKQDYTK